MFRYLFVCFFVVCSLFNPFRLWRVIEQRIALKHFLFSWRVMARVVRADKCALLFIDQFFSRWFYWKLLSGNFHQSLAVFPFYILQGTNAMIFFSSLLFNTLLLSVRHWYLCLVGKEQFKIKYEVICLH